MTPSPDTPSAPPVPTYADPRLPEPAGDLDLERTPLLAGEDDPDVVPAGRRDGTGSPLLDDLESALAELAKDVELPEVLLVNRRRKGLFAARYSIDFDGADIKKWRKAATSGKGDRREVDEFRLAEVALANLCLSIEVPDGDGGWRALEDDSGPLTFRSQRIQRAYGAARAGEAVSKFYVQDTYMTAVLDAVMAEAGLGEDIAPVDPSGGSSI